MAIAASPDKAITAKVNAAGPKGGTGIRFCSAVAPIPAAFRKMK
jgi:hypothetical protein